MYRGLLTNILHALAISEREKNNQIINVTGLFEVNDIVIDNYFSIPLTCFTIAFFIRFLLQIFPS